MREHEVPTHVQAEDRVLLWFTFPQVVAMMAVCALSHGAYRYAPVGPSEVRMALAVRRPFEVPAWGEALRRAAVRAGAERAARAGAAGEERPRPLAADGEAGGQDPAPPSPEAREPGADGRADALPPSPLVRQAQADGQGQHQRQGQAQEEEAEELPG